ncbi:MAG: hypothetical protein AB7P04_12805 [Bacteriovoracia bacterium]
MGSYKDILPSQQGWIHELARGEIHPEADKLLQLAQSDDPHQLVEESTIDFLTQLREQFTEYTKIFNGYSEAGARFQEIKIYSMANTSADFMLFRNTVKFVITNPSHGLIRLSFARHQRGAIPGAGADTADGNVPVDLIAQVGPFRNVFWSFQGEKVEPAQLARFYFAEFVRSTRDTSKSKAGNQLLLEQIKALLHEKGLDL